MFTDLVTSFENDKPRQEFLAESPQDFYSTNFTDEYTLKPAGGTAQILILHRARAPESGPAKSNVPGLTANL